MRIKKSRIQLRLEQKLKESDFLQLVLDEIFLVCMNDKNFSSNNMGDNLIDSKLENITNKINKQKVTIKESIKLQEAFSQKILFLDQENSKIKNKILNILENSEMNTTSKSRMSES